MKKVGIVVNPAKKGSAAVLKKLRAWFKGKRVEVRDSTVNSVKQVTSGASLIICLGGDGTILSVARQLQPAQIPILGVNLGHLGFLTEVKTEEVLSLLDGFLNGKAHIEERLMLACTVKNKRGMKQNFVALNDIVISREGLTKLLHIDVFVSGENLTGFRGDGLIVATPTGSTAYSLSAGGAIVHPELKALIVTPICPHASSLRPLVVGAKELITVKIKTTRKGENALLTADGQENFEIDDSYIVEITQAARSVKLLRNLKRNYIATLRGNFGFPHS